MENCIKNRWSLMTERRKQNRWELSDLIGIKTDELIEEIKKFEGLDGHIVNTEKVLSFILEKVADRHFTTVKELQSKARHEELVNARFEYVYLCETYPMEAEPHQIMRKINRSRSTFYNSLYMFKNYLFANDATTKGFRAFQLDLYKRISRRDIDL